MSYLITASKVGGAIASGLIVDAKEALERAEHYIDGGWKDVTLIEKATDHVLDEMQIRATLTRVRHGERNA